MTLDVNKAELKNFFVYSTHYRQIFIIIRVISATNPSENIFAPPSQVVSIYMSLLPALCQQSLFTLKTLVLRFAPLRTLISCQQEHGKTVFNLKFGMPTFKAFKRACSSSNAACFSLSSTFVRDRPVLASEETALERVVALK